MGDPVWCLICEQRPAVGVLLRLLVTTEEPASDIRPRVCRECGAEHDGKPAKSTSDGVATYHNFVVMDTAGLS